MKKHLLALCVSSIFALAASAAEVPYNFVELGYSSVDAGDADGDGFKIAGSYELTDDIYAFGDYASYGLDGDADFNYFGIGLGYKYSIQANTDITLDLAFRSAELDISGTVVDLDENGYEIGLGVRSMIQDNIEVGARIESVDIDGNETFFEINGTYYFPNNFGLGAEASFGDDFDFFGIKARYKY